MKDTILNLLNDPTYSPKTVEELAEVLEFESSDKFKELVKTLVELEDEHIVHRSKKNRFSLIENLGFIKGILTIHKKGFGFVINDKGDDIFIPESNMNGAIHQDQVLVQIMKSPTGKRQEGNIIKILERNFDVVVGTYDENKDVGYVVLDNQKIKADVIINKNKSKGAVPGHKVLVEIIKEVNNLTFEGKVVKILGHQNDPGVDILSIVYKHGISDVFPDEVLSQAEEIPEVINDEDLKDRRDIRDKLTITIDGADAKDLDDAISLEKLNNGNYKLSVHIADVSFYIQENSALDNEASERGTSVYLVDRVIPMIPHRLSNGICSLNPHVDRLTLTCDMEIDDKGKVVGYEIYQSVINSNERMTYGNVNKILEDNDEEKTEEYKHIVPMLKDMESLAAILRKARFERGSLDFEIPEPKILVNDEGKVTEIILRSRGTSEKMIEEFMLKANETVAEHFHWLNTPFMYRIHEKPKQKKLDNFISLVKIFGYKFKHSQEDIHPKTLQKILEEVKDADEGKILSTLLLRSMQKARYSEESVGHYGLASKYYTHFTSPIRRYPDLIVHRLIREYTIKGNIDEKTQDRYALVLPSISDHSSKKERSAIECERDVEDMKKAEFMEDHIGEEYEGIISSITNFGMFVELPNTIEGLVHMLDMTDDYYFYDERTLTLKGERTKKIYKMGQVVKVKVARASKEDAAIDFELVGIKDIKKRRRRREK